MQSERHREGIKLVEIMGFFLLSLASLEGREIEATLEPIGVDRGTLTTGLTTETFFEYSPQTTWQFLFRGL